ncbi:MAG: 2-oxoacid:acceptor oxidoreductase family protein [Oscillospiraceae bacterium]|nr:2-oxoacid:acceptor oxidoreductase family protein [Oscillospiraceae bacterium]MBQ8979674.1 2-oxoacid:acceptor oxidoreductase family protein [Oscillospiraceae bacterium]
MTEIIWIGRGGQGAFTAAKLLGAAFAADDRFSLAFPSFGPERRGAPVRAFTKLSDKPISDRSQTVEADHIVLLDKTLYDKSLHRLLKSSGTIIVNSRDSIPDTVTFDADSIARELKLPTVNTIMSGVLCGLYGTVSMEDLFAAVEKCMPRKLHEKNRTAVRRAFDEVTP